MHYRRVYVPRASYFLTLTLQDRQSNLLISKINQLRIAFLQSQKNHPFTIDGIVVLPDHLHLIMTLPNDEVNYSQRIGFIKSAFSRQFEPGEVINSSKKSKRERGIWQRRFWEHTIRNEQDYINHMNYLYYNPVKHGYVKTPLQWQYSSIHRSIHRGDWATAEAFDSSQFGE
ncbi:MAG: transposase [Tatlockia sp.]|jgi:putative transposase